MKLLLWFLEALLSNHTHKTSRVFVDDVLGSYIRCVECGKYREFNWLSMKEVGDWKIEVPTKSIRAITLEMHLEGDVNAERASDIEESHRRWTLGQHSASSLA